jgi:hypothetical protein
MTSKLWLSILAWLGIATSACSPMVYTKGVPNLAPVDVGKNIWRSGQIALPEGWQTVKAMGIQRIVKLNFEEEGTDQGAKDLGIEVVYLPIEPRENLLATVIPPDSMNIELALEELRKPNTLVHCTHGQDRTGLTVGAMRVRVYGWKKSRAWKEMMDNHFHWELPGLMEWWMDLQP